MSNGNIGYLYYKDYYNDITNKVDNDTNKDKFIVDFDNKNQIIIENSNVENCKKNVYRYNDKLKKVNNELLLKTTYPGLLVGSGYNHIIGMTGEFKLGFDFDYTTGLPIIRGSSIKGAIRSVFFHDKDILKDEKKEYLGDLLREIGIDIKKINLNDLKEEIFEGKKDKKSLSLYERDIFYDAEIDMIETKKLMGTNKNILGEDYITPHKEALKNPIPLKFIKVMPNVVWRFEFRLNNRIITKEQKLELFKRIILDLGIGAKTNVGYGRLEEL